MKGWLPKCLKDKYSPISVTVISGRERADFNIVPRSHIPCCDGDVGGYF